MASSRSTVTQISGSFSPINKSRVKSEIPVAIRDSPGVIVVEKRNLGSNAVLPSIMVSLESEPRSQDTALFFAQSHLPMHNGKYSEKADENPGST